ncbi:MAG: hypothetical protein P4M13_02100 [Alphaproteobacteria bacterium]|nr:hypothetical protein [Alphaproteobacteria bacterium]
MKHLTLSLQASVTLLALALGGCTGPIIEGSSAVMMAITSPSSPPPADTKDQIPQHESWCYSTMGDSQCYAHAQNVPPDRLINVDPQNLYPVDLPAYRNALNAANAAALPPPATEAPAPLIPVETTPVDKDSSKSRDDATSVP